MTIVAGALCMGALVGCTEKAKPAPPPPPTTKSERIEGKEQVEERTLTTVTATVVSVDQKTREVTLRGHDGKTETIKVGEEVRNLPQVHKGDQVVVRYYQAMVARLKKKGEPDVAMAEGVERAPVGAKPGAAGAQVVSIVAKVVEVDKKNKQIVLRGPEGKLAVVNVKQPKYLDVVKKGNLIEITYTEAVAIAVEPAPTKKK